MKIKYATAQYTGGGIYIYYGQLEDGNYFRGCDDWECIEICDTDTSMDTADYYEFYEEHRVNTLIENQYETFWNEMLLWIIHNAPKGNYSVNELERKMIKDVERKEGYRTIKITAGMTQEYEIIWTNAPDHVIKAQLMYIAACEEEGKQVPENPYGMIEEFGYVANVIGSQDSLTTEDLEDAIIDAEFDYYDLQEGELNL